MGQLVDHLKSPQFTDADGNATGPARMAMVVAPGKPRWLGYAFYLAGFVVATCDGKDTLDGGGVRRIAVSCEPRADRSVCEGRRCVAQRSRIGRVDASGKFVE